MEHPFPASDDESTASFAGGNAGDSGPSGSYLAEHAASGAEMDPPPVERKKASRPRNRAWGFTNTTYCCGFDRALRTIPATAFVPPLMSNAPQQKPVITIIEATKSTDMSGSTFIAYITRTDLPEHSLHFEAKHRYSEFESLRKLLSRLHPTIVVPPIPGKHSVAAYAAKPSKAKEDPSIIEKRKRMLQSFLNRIAAHPILNEEHVFHRFLEGEATWTEILATSGLGGYLKSKEGAVAGSERGPLKHPGSLVGSNPDPHFVLAEEYTAKFAAQVGQTLKVHRRIVKDYVDAAACSSDLGAAYNAWSLSETALSSAVEHVGQAIDSTVSATSQLAMSLEERFTDPMNEYAQFSQIIEKLLRWRHAKHVEYETVCESLVSKQSKLTRLESSEAEAQRLSAVLNAEGANGSSSSQHPSSSSPYSSATTTTTSPPTPRPSGLLATFNSFIDNDPDQTRRNAISKTKDQIDSLQSQRDTLHGQLVGANEDIQSDLNRFQVDKEKDLRNMLLGFAMAQRDYCRKCVGAWKEAKGEIEKIQT